MKIASIIAGALLGLMFVFAAVMVLFKLAPVPPLPEGTPMAHFMAALGPTGYLTFVKVFELLGGVLVAIPKTRRAGLLVLGPIILNILAFHTFVTAGQGLLNPQLIFIVVATLFLVWVEREAFARFLGIRPAATAQ
jgi:putative oxidoreductase